MCHAELLADLAHIPWVASLVEARGGAANYLQVSEPGEIGENFILHRRGEEGVSTVVAQVLERQDRDALIRNRAGRGRDAGWRGKRGLSPAPPKEKEDGAQRANGQRDQEACAPSRPGGRRRDRNRGGRRLRNGLCVPLRRLAVLPLGNFSDESVPPAGHGDDVALGAGAFAEDAAQRRDILGEIVF